MTTRCVLWPTAMRYGGMIKTPIGRVRPHVYACYLVNGPKPEGKEAAHGCGKSRCFNGRHLRWSTRRENHADMETHGTAQRGAKNGQTKLTRRQARTALQSRQPAAALAAKFGVSRSAVQQLRDRKSWKHL